jgi:hypothetical protein
VDQTALARRFSLAMAIFFGAISETLNSQQVSEAKNFSNLHIFFLMRA